MNKIPVPFPVSLLPTFNADARHAPLPLPEFVANLAGRLWSWITGKLHGSSNAVTADKVNGVIGEGKSLNGATERIWGTPPVEELYDEGGEGKPLSGAEERIWGTPPC